MRVTGRSATNLFLSARWPGGICGPPPDPGVAVSHHPGSSWAGGRPLGGRAGGYGDGREAYRLLGGDGVRAEVARAYVRHLPGGRAGQKRLPGSYGMNLRHWFQSCSVPTWTRPRSVACASGPPAVPGTPMHARRPARGRRPGLAAPDHHAPGSARHPQTAPRNPGPRRMGGPCRWGAWSTTPATGAPRKRPARGCCRSAPKPTTARHRWAHEMRAWINLTTGDYHGVVAAARGRPSPD